jgi:hypothetical protein
MSTIEKLRENWKALYKTSKGSDEERKAYQVYIQATQGIKPDKADRKKLNKAVKAIQQPDIKGISQTDTFLLVNPETQWSQKLSNSKPMEQIGLF